MIWEEEVCLGRRPRRSSNSLFVPRALVFSKSHSSSVATSTIAFFSCMSDSLINTCLASTYIPPHRDSPKQNLSISLPKNLMFLCSNRQPFSVANVQAKVSITSCSDMVIFFWKSFIHIRLFCSVHSERIQLGLELSVTATVFSSGHWKEMTILFVSHGQIFGIFHVFDSYDDQKPPYGDLPFRTG